MDLLFYDCDEIELTEIFASVNLVICLPRALRMFRACHFQQ